jgi:polyhydroxyalkanoate synthesis regulator protein
MSTRSDPILIKRYARSRLYDTSGLCYVSVENLRDWQMRGIAFVVREATTGDDITRVVLA